MVWPNQVSKTASTTGKTVLLCKQGIPRQPFLALPCPALPPTPADSQGRLGGKQGLFSPILQLQGVLSQAPGKTSLRSGPMGTTRYCLTGTSHMDTVPVAVQSPLFWRLWQYCLWIPPPVCVKIYSGHKTRPRPTPRS